SGDVPGRLVATTVFTEASARGNTKAIRRRDSHVLGAYPGNVWQRPDQAAVRLQPGEVRIRRTPRASSTRCRVPERFSRRMVSISSTENLFRPVILALSRNAGGTTRRASSLLLASMMIHALWSPSLHPQSA